MESENFFKLAKTNYRSYVLEIIKMQFLKWLKSFRKTYTIIYIYTYYTANKNFVL